MKFLLPPNTPHDYQTERPLLQKVLFMGFILAIIFIGSCRVVQAAEYTDQQIANAIYHTEHSKAHPYGIMVKYKHTTPRQACLNTVRHKRRDWVREGENGEFITYLAKHYAPIGASNDPSGLNRNWENNIRYFLRKG